MTVFLHFGIAIALFAVILALAKRPNQVSDKIFVVFLISIIFPMAMMVFGFHSQLIDRFSLFMPLTLGPFMLIYTESLITDGLLFSKGNLRHFLPFAICLPLSFLSSREVIFSVPELQLQGPNFLEVCYVLLLMLSFLFYSIWIHRRLKHHRRNVLDYFTQSSTRITLGWLTWVVSVFFNIFILVHIPRFFRLFNLFPEISTSTVFDNLHSGGFVLFIVVLSFFAVRQQQVYQEPVEAQTQSPAAVVAPEPPVVEEKAASKQKGLLSDDQLEAYLAVLEASMQQEKPYLENDLTLAQLATLLKMPKHHLTEVINRKLEKNFFNYINDYRIAEVKPLLQNPDNADKTILTLAFEVGFNSKTTFNTIFKKTTQMTPTQYRKQFSN
jgi:AraC-like DNA-binding protein